jgi:hypothetical protein
MSQSSENLPPNGDHARQRLPEPVANRLLERASEIDARLRAGSTVAELREAAKAAGITAEAFDAALAEVQPEAKQAPVMEVEPAAPQARSFAYGRFVARFGLWLIPLMLPVLYLMMTAGRRQRSFDSRSAAPMYPLQELRLTCLSADEAAAVVRPVVMQEGSAAHGFRMVTRQDQPAILRVAAPDALMREIRTAIAKAEGDPTRTCSLGGTS